MLLNCVADLKQDGHTKVRTPSAATCITFTLAMSAVLLMAKNVSLQAMPLSVRVTGHCQTVVSGTSRGSCLAARIRATTTDNNVST